MQLDYPLCHRRTCCHCTCPLDTAYIYAKHMCFRYNGEAVKRIHDDQALTIQQRLPTVLENPVQLRCRAWGPLERTQLYVLTSGLDVFVCRRYYTRLQYREESTATGRYKGKSDGVMAIPTQISWPITYRNPCMQGCTRVVGDIRHARYSQLATTAEGGPTTTARVRWHIRT